MSNDAPAPRIRLTRPVATIQSYGMFVRHMDAIKVRAQAAASVVTATGKAMVVDGRSMSREIVSQAAQDVLMQDKLAVGVEPAVQPQQLTPDDVSKIIPNAK